MKSFGRHGIFILFYINKMHLEITLCVCAVHGVHTLNEKLVSVRNQQNCNRNTRIKRRVTFFLYLCTFSNRTSGWRTRPWRKDERIAVRAHTFAVHSRVGSSDLLLKRLFMVRVHCSLRSIFRHSASVIRVVCVLLLLGIQKGTSILFINGTQLTHIFCWEPLE